MALTVGLSTKPTLFAIKGSSGDRLSGGTFFQLGKVSTHFFSVLIIHVEGKTLVISVHCIVREKDDKRHSDCRQCKYPVTVNDICDKTLLIDHAFC